VLRASSIEDVIIHSSAAPVGKFACRTNCSIASATRALGAAFEHGSVLTDCRTARNSGWLEQYHLNGPAIRYEFDVARIYTKGMHDMADAQFEDGLVPNVAPYYPEFRGHLSRRRRMAPRFSSCRGSSTSSTAISTCCGRTTTR